MAGKGTLFIISAPSGAGKSTLIQSLLQQPNIRLSVSHTTRDKRPIESHGEDYYFVSTKQFEHLISENAFLEHAFVFGRYYGTTYEMIDTTLAQGQDLILDIDWQGARQVRLTYPSVRSIFILPPSLYVLEQRLVTRAQDSNEAIRLRMQKAVDEISHYNEYDYLIINDKLEQAKAELRAIYVAESLLFIHQQEKYQEFVSKLLAEQHQVE